MTTNELIARYLHRWEAATKWMTATAVAALVIGLILLPVSLAAAGSLFAGTGVLISIAATLRHVLNAVGGYSLEVRTSQREMVTR